MPKLLPANPMPNPNMPKLSMPWVRWIIRELKELRALVNEALGLGRMGVRAGSAERKPATGGLTGGHTGAVPRWAADGSTVWTYEWQGLMPEYYIYLAAGAAEYTPMGLELDDDVTKALLPPIEFDATGTIMYPIDFGNYPDNPDAGILMQGGQSPVHLSIIVAPTFNGEEFNIYLPSYDNFFGVTAPFFTFDLYNTGSFTANVLISDTYLYYEGTTIPVLGVFEADANPWILAPGFQGAWFVRNVKGWGAAATPMSHYYGGSPDAYMTDPWYEDNVRGTREMFPLSRDGVQTISQLPRSLHNDAPVDLRIGKIRCTVGTAPTGASLKVDIKVGGTTILTAPVEILATTKTAVITATGLSNHFWAAGSELTAHVTQIGTGGVAGSDLTVEVWAGA